MAAGRFDIIRRVLGWLNSPAVVDVLSVNGRTAVYIGYKDSSKQTLIRDNRVYIPREDSSHVKY